MPHNVLRFWLCMIAPVLIQAQPVAEAAGQLAARISSLLPPRATASFEVQNTSSLPAGPFSSFRTALEDDLKKTGIEIAAAGQPDSGVRVSISENVRGILLVAEVRTGDRRETIFQPWTFAVHVETGRPKVTLGRKPVWEQPEPILDFASVNSDRELLVLSAGNISLYRMAEGKWALATSIGISHSRPLPRDPRGRLIVERDTFRAFLPGTSCNGVSEVPLVITCNPGNEPWVLDSSNRGPAVHWISDRNYLEFSGAQEPFYSAVSLDSGGRLVIAASDGHIRDRGNEPVAGADAWGSDLTGPLQACGSNSLVIADRAGDGEASDAVQVYELTQRAVEPVSEMLSLAGTVTSLWSAGSAPEVNVVLRNTKTGNYEASRLVLACAE